MKATIVRMRGRILTPNPDPGRKVYGERLTRFKGKEYREWSPWRSKLAAYLASKGRHLNPTASDHWLYLGAASGTTVSHVADLLPQGRVAAVEFSVRPFHDLVALARTRTNILPILSDASRPEAYAPLIERPVDVVYQDIAQRDQDDIFDRNARRFLRPGGTGFLAVKARSVDVAARPDDIFKRLAGRLRDRGWTLLETVRLDPQQKDHAMLVVTTG